MLAKATPQEQRLLAFIEAIGLFTLGFLLMTYFYHGSLDVAGQAIGAPGHDSFYHTRMAAMIPEVGVLQTFPWLEYVYFTQRGDGFVSHHFGFHVVLMPFVLLGEALTGEALNGARWAMSAFFGLNLVLFNLLLRAGRVPWRGVWIVLFLLLPHQFFLRHAYVRAIGLSLICMQFLVLMLVQRRYAFAGLAVAVYIHVYLGAVLYTPVIVGLFAVVMVMGRSEDRQWPWRMVAWTAGGWIVGVLTYPYAAGMLEFLQLQVVGSGLSPDIEVGREWRPYTDPWWFVSMSAVPLTVWLAALVSRLRMGPRLDAHETGILLLQLVFLVLTLKARRFIEYWPPMGLLSAAYLSAPVIEGVWRGTWQRLRKWTGRRSSRADWIVAGLAGATALGLLIVARRSHGTSVVVADWGAVAALLALLMLPPLVRTWVPVARSYCGVAALLRLAAIPACGLLLIAGVGVFSAWYEEGMLVGTPKLGRGHDLPEARWGWMSLAAWYMVVPALFYARSTISNCVVRNATWPRTLSTLAIGFCLFGATAAYAGRQLGTVARQAACKYDLPAIKAMMEFLKQHSEAGDIVFTDDWDIFPVFFYHNTQNRYIVGLDPKFTHERRPDLWERYVRITRGQAPTRSRVRVSSGQRPPVYEEVNIRLRDIRDAFGARYVITDRGHQALARQLAQASSLATLVYPGHDYDHHRDAPYLVFRIDGENEGDTLVDGGAATAATHNDVREMSGRAPAAAEHLAEAIRKEVGWR